MFIIYAGRWWCYVDSYVWVRVKVVEVVYISFVVVVLEDVV
jgi:hypothetical protein